MCFQGLKIKVCSDSQGQNMKFVEPRHSSISQKHTQRKGRAFEPQTKGIEITVTICGRGHIQRPPPHTQTPTSLSFSLSGARSLSPLLLLSLSPSLSLSSLCLSGSLGGVALLVGWWASRTISLSYGIAFLVSALSLLLAKRLSLSLSLDTRNSTLDTLYPSLYQHSPSLSFSRLSLAPCLSLSLYFSSSTLDTLYLSLALDTHTHSLFLSLSISLSDTLQLSQQARSKPDGAKRTAANVLSINSVNLCQEFL